MVDWLIVWLRRQTLLATRIHCSTNPPIVACPWCELVVPEKMLMTPTLMLEPAPTKMEPPVSAEKMLADAKV